jgi:hypothetical protein
VHFPIPRHIPINPATPQQIGSSQASVCVPGALVGLGSPLIRWRTPRSSLAVTYAEAYTHQDQETDDTNCHPNDYRQVLHAGIAIFSRLGYSVAWALFRLRRDRLPRDPSVERCAAYERWRDWRESGCIGWLPFDMPRVLHLDATQVVRSRGDGLCRPSGKSS